MSLISSHYVYSINYLWPCKSKTPLCSYNLYINSWVISFRTYIAACITQWEPSRDDQSYDFKLCSRTFHTSSIGFHLGDQAGRNRISTQCSSHSHSSRMVFPFPFWIAAFLRTRTSPGLSHHHSTIASSISAENRSASTVESVIR